MQEFYLLFENFNNKKQGGYTTAMGITPDLWRKYRTYLENIKDVNDYKLLSKIYRMITPIYNGKQGCDKYDALFLFNELKKMDAFKKFNLGDWLNYNEYDTLKELEDNFIKEFGIDDFSYENLFTALGEVMRELVPKYYNISNPFNNFKNKIRTQINLMNELKNYIGDYPYSLSNFTEAVYIFIDPSDYDNLYKAFEKYIKRGLMKVDDIYIREARERNMSIKEYLDNYKGKLKIRLACHEQREKNLGINIEWDISNKYFR